jgi:hypothetical protein
LSGLEHYGASGDAALRPGTLDSLERRLRRLAWAVVAPVVLVACVAVGAAWHRERQALERTLRDTGRTLALAVDRELGLLEGVGWAIAGSDALAASDLAPFQRLAIAATHRVGAWVVVVEHPARGAPARQLLNSTVPLGRPLPRGLGLSQFDGWKDAAARVSDLFVGPVNGGWVTTVTVPSPIVRDGARLAVSIATGPERFQELMTAQGFPEGWSAGVLDRSGRVVARVPDPQRWVGEPAPPPVLERLRERREGAVELTTFEGRRATAYVSESPVYGWWFAIAVPDRERLARLAAGVLPVLMAGVLAIAVSVGLALRLAGRGRRAIAALSKAADAVCDGRRVEWSATGFADVDRIGAALADASRDAAKASA